MRVNFKHVFYGLMAVAATVVGTSCSSNNDNNGREETLTDIHPTKVFKGGLPKKAVDADVTTDKFGRVVKFVSALISMKSHSNTWTRRARVLKKDLMLS